MTGQIALPLDFAARGGEKAFVVGEANRDAVSRLSTWSSWPDGAVILVGPEKSGKTHLVRLMKERLDGRLSAWEDWDRREEDETALFHALNRAREGRELLVLTARTLPGQWTIGLPDLRSRIGALPILEIGLPDDALLEELLAEKFARRGLNVAPDVITYVARRAERSYEAIERLVAAIDRTALEQGRRITIPLVAKLMEEE